MITLHLDPTTHLAALNALEYGIIRPASAPCDKGDRCGRNAGSRYVCPSCIAEVRASMGRGR